MMQKIRLNRQTAKLIIIATAVLHNIAINMNEEELDIHVPVELENFNQNIRLDQNRNLMRQELIEEYFKNL